MKTSDFDFELPPELIAQHPLAERSDSRMLVLDRESGRVVHRYARDLPEYLRPDDLLVVNNTKVLPMRTYGCKRDSGGRVEVLFLDEVGPCQWRALCGASRFPKVGQTLTLLEGRLEVQVVELFDKGEILLQAPADVSVRELLRQYGLMPLPPYIRRASNRNEGVVVDAWTTSDRDRYQTVYAEFEGAAAAPTAGLHLDEGVFEALKSKGVQRASVTLHVGLGTFRGVEVEHVEDHRMHREHYDVSTEAAAAISACRERSGRILGVGSTSVKSLETMMDTMGCVVPVAGESELFIYPPFTFRVTDMILTNFHLPQSSLMMMMSAFCGREVLLDAYRQAIEERYRFFSYGDSMLIL